MFALVVWKICFGKVTRGGETLCVCRAKTNRDEPNRRNLFWFTADVKLIAAASMHRTLFYWLWIIGKLLTGGVMGGHSYFENAKQWCRFDPFLFVVECKAVGIKATVGLSLRSATGKHEPSRSTHHQGTLFCRRRLDKQYFGVVSTQPAPCSMKKHISLQSHGGLLNKIHLGRSLNSGHILTLKSKSHHPPLHLWSIFSLYF